MIFLRNTSSVILKYYGRKGVNMFKWGMIAVAGVFFFAGIASNVNAGFIWYNASGSVVNSTTGELESFIGMCTLEDVDYGDLTDYDYSAHFDYQIRDFCITSEKSGTFSGFRGALSYFTHDTYLQLLGTGFTDELFGDYLELNWDDEIEGWKNVGLRDNYWFPCWRLDGDIFFQDIALTKYNHIPEPGAQKFLVLGMFALSLLPLGMMRTRHRFAARE